MPSDKPLIHFVVDLDFIKQIDDYRFKHRFKSRAAAMKFLMRHALSQDPEPAASDDRGDD